ncbi:MAG: terminase small subunit-like protein [Burkholderiales bacterium]
MAGRPSTYSVELTDEICDRIASGESLNKIVKDDGMPNPSTVYKWLTEHKAFSEKYVRARESQADTLADEILAIADEHPITEGDSGKIDPAWVTWQKNRVDARKWTASKLKPKAYGDKLDLDAKLSGEVSFTKLVREIVKPDNPDA